MILFCQRSAPPPALTPCLSPPAVDALSRSTEVPRSLFRTFLFCLSPVRQLSHSGCDNSPRHGKFVKYVHLCPLFFFPNSRARVFFLPAIRATVIPRTTSLLRPSDLFSLSSRKDYLPTREENSRVLMMPLIATSASLDALSFLWQANRFFFFEQA